jgi:hypothetical protein
MLSILNFLVFVFISAYVLGFLTYDLGKPIDSPQAAIDPLKQLETTTSTDRDNSTIPTEPAIKV